MKTCKNCTKEFQIMPEDFAFYEKMKVPPPTFCPQCRFVRRLSWRNERSLYTRLCDKCGKNMISVFSKDTGLTVYCQPCWWSDDWDPMDYGIFYDPKKSFIAQTVDLFKKVPVMGLFSLYPTLVNSEYTNMVGNLKDCYLLTHSDYNENCSYGSFVDNSKDCFDNLMIDGCELCYENINCRACYKTMYSLDCQNCNSVFFSKNCVACTDCFGCVNLRSKQHCFFNEQCTREEYEKKVCEHSITSRNRIDELTQKTKKFWIGFPQKYIHSRNSEYVSGDYIYNSKNTLHSYIVADAEDCKYCATITPGGLKDSYDFTHYGTKSELLYETLQAGDQVSRIIASWFVISSASAVEHSMFIISSHDVFGSVGLRKSAHCILNKQYSENEYSELRARIIEDMKNNPYVDVCGNAYAYGDFFPTELSPFFYNETALEYFPLKKDEVLEMGYRWLDSKDKGVASATNPLSFGEDIRDVKDDIVKCVLACAHAGHCDELCSIAFKITAREFAFHKEHGIALPILCFNCRHFRRATFRNGQTLYARTCACTIDGHGHNGACSVSFETSYAPDRLEIVYCEECYQKEVI